MKIALFTMAVGKNRIYFDSVARYFPYNKKYFGQQNKVDYYLFTDRDEKINNEVINIPCVTTVWPYTTLLKNNLICDFLEQENKWGEYSHVFFIDADFAIGDYYDFFSSEFLLVKPYWNNKNGGGFFYGGMTKIFKKLCFLYYNELQFIYENKLSIPRDLDEYYLGLFLEQYENEIHIIEMTQQNTLIFYDNESLHEKIKLQGRKTFMQPFKAEGRANKTMVLDANYEELECIVNLEEKYIFNNYNYDFGRLVDIDNDNYRILWSKWPEKREIFNIRTHSISNNVILSRRKYISPVLSVIMCVYNIYSDHLKESIESILEQTFHDFELIILCEDLIGESFIEIINGYKDSRIKLLINNNDFIKSLNRAIASSKGEYIVRADANSVMIPNRLDIQYRYMEMNLQVDICGSWGEIINADAKSLVKTPVKHKDIICAMLLNNSIIPSSVIFRKSIVQKMKQPYKSGYPFAEDYKLWTDLVHNQFHFANISKALVKYFPLGITDNNLKKLANSLWRIKIEYSEYVIQQIAEENFLIDIYNSFVDLLTEKKINLKRFLNIVHELFLNHFEKNN